MEAGIEITATLRLDKTFDERFREEVRRCDVVIINGEGTMHHDAVGALVITHAGVMAARLGVPVALINTVWQDNIQAIDLLSSCQWISTRESISRDAIVGAGFFARVVPDLTLSSDPASLYANVEPLGGVVVMDDVRLEVSLMLAQYAKARGLPFFPMGGRPSLRTVTGLVKWARLGLASRCTTQFHMGQVETIKRASLVVTGRFHGVCLAILAKRPFIAFASNTYKIEGLLKDANLGPAGRLLADPPLDPLERNAFIDQSIDQVMAYMRLPANRAAYEDACEVYLQNARQSVRSMFEGIVCIGLR